MGDSVTVFLPSLAGGGAERSIVTIANGLARRGAEVTLVLSQAAGPFRSLVADGIDVVDLASPSPLRTVQGLAHHLRQHRPRALLSAMSHANVMATLAHAWARSPARLVLSERAHASSLFQAHRDLRNRLTRLLMPWCYPRADAVVAVSDGVARDLDRLVRLAPGRIVTIANPVVDDGLRLRAAEMPAHPWLQQPAGARTVLAAGRLNAQKDFATLLEAFACLCRPRPERPLRLLILGEGEERSALQAQAARLGIADVVDMPGFDANPFAAMRAADLFVLSSRFEGLPGVLIQAMACGAPVVSTDCPSGPREILQDGRWGRLVPVGDAQALAAAMRAALADPAPPDVRLRAQDYDEETAVRRYAEVLGLH